jgi:hypothetical protein
MQNYELFIVAGDTDSNMSIVVLTIEEEECSVKRNTYNYLFFFLQLQWRTEEGV